MTDSNSTPQSEAPLELPQVLIFVDGSCEPNPGAAGIGAVLISGTSRKEISEPIGRATNNAAEIQAAITALTALKKTCSVIVYSDSQYLVRTMNGEYNRSTNNDLWRDLDFACLRHTVQWKWIRGHDGNPNNERAHTLAEQGMRRSKS